MRRVVIACNPASGRGRASAAARSLVPELERRGHAAVVADIGPGRDPLPAALRGADALVIAGGDGTVSRALPAAAAAGVALYHIPLGTENLFAREFGMTRAGAASAVQSWRDERIDLGRCNGRLFALMVGVGFDGEVIRRLDAARNGPISRAAYLGPILRALAEFRPPVLTVRIDGRTVVDRLRGSLVIANCRRYGAGLNPAPRASPRDGLLDAVFIPQSGPARLALGMAAARLRLLGIAGALRARGRAIEIEPDGPTPVQVDGEAFTPEPGLGQWRVLVEVAPSAGRVLLAPLHAGAADGTDPASLQAASQRPRPNP